MFRRRQSDVLVVGAGPVGLTAAILLVDRGIGVELIDERFEGEAASLPDHAVLLHPSSLELLESVGVGPEITAAPGRVDRIVVYAGRSPHVTVRLDALGRRFPFAVAVGHRDLMRALDACLHQRRKKVRAPARLSELEQGGERALAVVQELTADSGGLVVDGHLYMVRKTREQHPRFVIASDGPRSTARRRVNIELDRAGPPATYAIAEFEAGDQLADEARVVVGEHTVDAMWPLGEGRCRWTLQIDAADQNRFPLHAPRDPMDVEAAPMDLVTRYLEERAPWFHGEPDEEALCIGVEPAFAHSFGLGRVWLAGDAAHIANPIGAHSVNAGFLEVLDLANGFDQVLHAGAPPAVLDRYDIERNAEWRRASGVDGPFSLSAPDEWLAAHSADLVACMPATGADLPLLASQIGVDLRVA